MKENLLQDKVVTKMFDGVSVWYHLLYETLMSHCQLSDFRFLKLVTADEVLILWFKYNLSSDDKGLNVV